MTFHAYLKYCSPERAYAISIVMQPLWLWLGWDHMVSLSARGEDHEHHGSFTREILRHVLPLCPVPGADPQ